MGFRDHGDRDSQGQKRRPADAAVGWAAGPKRGFLAIPSFPPGHEGQEGVREPRAVSCTVGQTSQTFAG